LQSHHDIQVILLLHFFVYIVVDGQDLKAGNHPRPFCSPISCDAKDKNHSCAICHRGKMKFALQSHHDIQVILLLHFFVYIVVDGQDLKAGNHPRPFCSPISCDAKDKNHSCAICHRGKMKFFFKSREECASACK
ncbi:hypothetical protein IGI04_005920, partial [Brassica rapa subsp. trilocularis]